MKKTTSSLVFLTLMSWLFSFQSVTAQKCLQRLSVNCSPEGDAWQVVKRAVVKWYSQGGDAAECTGVLLNNTNFDGRGLILTAHHCLDDTYVVGGQYNFTYQWDYEVPGCSGSAPDNGIMTGGTTTILARSAETDFMLLEMDLSELDGSGFTPYFAGWDVSGNDPGGIGAVIHHPGTGAPANVKPKSIALVEDILVLNQNCDTPPDMPEDQVGFWWHIIHHIDANGPSFTQQGSSGSPLFGSHQLVIGQLFGCNEFFCTPTAGRLNHSFDGGGDGTPGKRLDLYLDPTGTGVTYLEGMEDDCRLGVYLDMDCEERGPFGQFASCDLQAVVVGGTGPFIYEWESSYAPVEAVEDLWEDICGEHYYAVTITDVSTGCTATYGRIFEARSECVVSDPVAGHTSQPNLAVADNDLIYRFPVVEEEDELEIIIYDITGRVILRSLEPVAPGQMEINVSLQALEKGMYFIGVISKRTQQMNTRKIFLH